MLHGFCCENSDDSETVKSGGDCENSDDSETVKSGGDINWDNVGCGLSPTDFMYIMKCSIGGEFSEGNLVPYGK